MDEHEAKKAATDSKRRETLRVHNALTRTKLRQAEKRVEVLTKALSNIATSELPVGFQRVEEIPGVIDEQTVLEAVQDYALFIVNSGFANPERLAVVGYVKGGEVFCFDCAKRQHGSMEPVYSGVDFVVCAGCKAGLFVE